MAQLTQEFLLKEVAGALFAHRRLLDQSTKIESECSSLDKLNNDKTSAAGGRAPSSGKAAGSSGSSPASPRKALGPSSGGTVKAGLSPKTNKLSSPPRRKMDGLSGKLNFSPTDKDKQDTMESFDARLQAIITSALMGDGSALADTKDGKIAEDIKQTIIGNLGLHGGLRFPPFVGPDHSKHRKPVPGAGAAAPPLDHKNDVVIKREKESPKGGGSASQISLPVNIPLKDVGRKPASLPVSIPLLGVNCQGKVAREPVHSRAGSPPALRDAYSPISRPSSSSSTASAESVKGLPHGATRRSTSPRTPHSATINSFNIDSIVCEAQRSAAASTGSRFIPPLPHAHKDSYVGPLSPGAHHSKAATGPAAHPMDYSMYPRHFPPPPMLGLVSLSPAEKESYAHLHPGAKQLLMNSGSSYMLPSTSQHSQAFYGYPGTLNGLPKDSPLMMEKAKRPKRKRSNSSSGSGSKLGPTDAKKQQQHAPTPPSQQPEIVSMMSNASQPLPIQAIADAESNSHCTPIVRHGQRVDLPSTYFFIIIFFCP